MFFGKFLFKKIVDGTGGLSVEDLSKQANRAVAIAPSPADELLEREFEARSLMRGVIYSSGSSRRSSAVTHVGAGSTVYNANNATSYAAANATEQQAASVYHHMDAPYGSGGGLKSHRQSRRSGVAGFSKHPDPAPQSSLSAHLGSLPGPRSRQTMTSDDELTSLTSLTSLTASLANMTMSSIASNELVSPKQIHDGAVGGMGGALITGSKKKSSLAAQPTTTLEERISILQGKISERQEMISVNDDLCSTESYLLRKGLVRSLSTPLSALAIPSLSAHDGNSVHSISSKEARKVALAALNLPQPSSTTAHQLNRSIWHKGTIVHIQNDGTLDVDYEDGQREIAVKPELVRLLKPEKAHSKAFSIHFVEGLKIEVKKNSWGIGQWSQPANDDEDALALEAKLNRKVVFAASTGRASDLAYLEHHLNKQRADTFLALSKALSGNTKSVEKRHVLEPRHKNEVLGIKTSQSFLPEITNFSPSSPRSSHEGHGSLGSLSVNSLSNRTNKGTSESITTKNSRNSQSQSLNSFGSRNFTRHLENVKARPLSQKLQVLEQILNAQKS